MNTFHILATVPDYPRTLDKKTNEIRMRCVNVRTVGTGGPRAQKLTREIPVHAFGALASRFKSLLKHTRHVLITGYISVTGGGRIILIAQSYTHLQSPVQQAKEYIKELYEQGEVLKSADLPIYDLDATPGKITIENPDSNEEIEWLN